MAAPALQNAVAHARRLAALRWPWIVLLVVFALCYFGSYVRYGIGFRDEGQTVALGAQRLLNGERPFIDVVLNYNVMWFYPVVWLYKIFGVSYVLLRGWCLALSTLTAVLGFLLVEKTSRRPWFAFLVSLVLVLIPGSPFKNYIPLLAVANTLALVHFVMGEGGARRGVLRALIGGVVLGLSYLIRIDIALFFTALWLGVLLLRAVLGPERIGARLAISAASLAVVGAATFALHVPFYIDAQRRGFAGPFLDQYAEKWRMISHPVKLLVKAKPPARPAKPKLAAATPAAVPKPVAPKPVAPKPAAAPEKKTLERATVEDIDADGQNAGHAFVFLTYAPIFVVIVFLAWALACLVRGLRACGWEEGRRGIAVCALIGGALTTFPQFFFFRPDVPHLSEFMVGFLASGAAALALMWARPAARWLRVGFTVLLAIHAAVYVVRILPDRWAGTWTIKHKRTKFFTAENGVRVFVSGREFKGLTEIQRIIREHSQPGDYVVCYPYSPGINVMMDRPTYERNVYVDNAMRTSKWDDEAIARFEKHKPAVIVLSDWDINGTDASRFSVWAGKTKTWIQTHYIPQGGYKAGSDTFEIFTRPEPAQPR